MLFCSNACMFTMTLDISVKNCYSVGSKYYHHYARNKKNYYQDTQG